MNLNDWKPWRSGMAVTASLLLTLAAGAALAAPIPSTTEHRNATQPMITGTAISVNEHQLLVATEQGEEVLLALDSRTMVPADLAPDMMMRVEFTYLNDGRRLAKRVIPIRSGQKTTRELAYSLERDTDEDDVALARYASTGGNIQYRESRSSNASSVTNRPLGSALTPIPATDAYVVATQPMVAGRVVSVNDHRIVIDTDQGQLVTLEMDSRTLIPSSLRSEMGVRIEYRTMDNGVMLANRITPTTYYAMQGENLANLDEGSGIGVGDEEAQEEYDVVTAQYQPQEGSTTEDTPGEVTATEEDRLPQTASRQPLILLFGLLALGAAAGLMYARRVRAA